MTIPKSKISPGLRGDEEENRESPVCVKICGITNLEDARCAAEEGADLLGFVFYAGSPRYVPPEQVKAIGRAVRSEFGASRPRLVGVFVDEPAEQVQAILDYAGLDLAQLHGAEPPDQLQALSPRAFKAIRPQTPDDAVAQARVYAASIGAGANRPDLMLDAYHPQQFGGTGTPVDLEMARQLAGRLRLLLAGGLNPETVGSAVEAVRPWGVDVSSGVERAKGLKDHGQVRAFIAAVQAAERLQDDGEASR